MGAVCIHPLCISYIPCFGNSIPHSQLKEAQAEGAAHQSKAVTVSVRNHAASVVRKQRQRGDCWSQVALSFFFSLSFIMFV